MTDLGNRYALNALKAKRASLAGEITLLKKKLAWAQDSIRHVDATLMLFDPNGDPSGIRAKRPQKRIKLFRQGELGRLILGTLRRAGHSLGTHEVVAQLLSAGGFGEEAKASLGPRVRGNLAYLERSERVVKIGRGRYTKWAMKPLNASSLKLAS